jgi:hypothetical protein
LIEVRGRDGDEELPLATLIVCCDEIPVGGAFRDSVAHEADQEIEIQLTPMWDGSGNIESAQVAVSYAAPRKLRSISWLAKRLSTRLTQRLRDHISEDSWPSYGWLWTVGVLVALVALVTMIIFLRHEPQTEVPEKAAQPPVEEQKPVSPAIPPPPPSKETVPFIARANWSTDPRAALSAIPIEPTRGEAKAIDISGKTRISLSLPLYNDVGRKYPRYRVVIAAGEKRIWQKVLRAPSTSLTGNAHILNLVLSPERALQKISLDVRVEGWGSGEWQTLGHASLNRAER